MMHAHLGVTIQEEEKIMLKYYSFYDESDVRELSTIIDYALSKSFVFSE